MISTGGSNSCLLGAGCSSRQDAGMGSRPRGPAASQTRRPTGGQPALPRKRRSLAGPARGQGPGARQSRHRRCCDLSRVFAARSPWTICGDCGLRCAFPTEGVPSPPPLRPPRLLAPPARPFAFTTWPPAWGQHLEELRARCPRTAQAFAQAEQALRDAGAFEGEPGNLLDYMREPQHKRQGHWGKAASEAGMKRRLGTLLDEDGRLSLRSAGGTGTGFFLLRLPSAPPGKHFLTNPKTRLDMPVSPEGGPCASTRTRPLGRPATSHST